MKFPSPALLLSILLWAAIPATAALENLAPSGTATASSQGYGTVAADGNDGNRNGAYNLGSVFHSNNEAIQSYWQVTLPSVRYLDHVRIFNRTDAVQGSVSNFRIIAKNGSTEVFNQIFLAANATDQNNAKAWGTAQLRGVQANFVRIERVSQTVPSVNFLTFAEFELWGSTTPLDPLITPALITASTAGFGSAAGDASDGDINGNFYGPGFPVYHSLVQGVGQFWEMTFSSDHVVKSLLLFNRSDAILTTDAKVSLLDASGATVWTQNVNLTQGAATPYAYGLVLTPNTAGRKLRVETLNNEFLGLAEVQAFGTPATINPPIVQNLAATGIGANKATLGASVLNTGFQAPNVKIYHGPVDGGTTPGSWANVADLGTQSGNATVNITALSQNTTYYFRAFAQNSAGSDWSDLSGSFTTLTALPASLELIQAYGITGFTATLNGRVTNDGNDAPSVTLYWGTTDAGATAAGWTGSASLGVPTNAFGQLVNGLVPETTYFYRAAATNAAGTSWTPAQSFTTVTKQPVVINEIYFKPADRTKDIQFIELRNPSNTAIDLTGWRLADGVEFHFPAATTLTANGYLVIAANPAAFQASFGFAPLGPWLGNLKKSGEVIELRNAADEKVDDVDFKEGFPWPTSAAGGGPSMELIHPSLENDLGGSWRSSTQSPLPQTPGAANSVSASFAPPNIRTVDHLPELPTATTAVTITAKISDVTGIASATLQYQSVAPGNYLRKTDATYATSWTSISMNDSGTGADAVAADGIYSASIPGAVQVHRHLIRYRISATNQLGLALTVPYADDEQPNFAYLVYNGLPSWTGALQPGASGARGTAQTYPPEILAQFEPWHLIANETDVTNSQYNGGSNDVRFFGTLVYEGKVFDHIQFKNRGKGSIYVSGKNKWALFFNRARDITVKDNWGNAYEPWNSIALDANASPWCAVHRGAAGVEEASSYRMFELGGLPALRTNYVHWRVIDNAQESGPTQYDGDLWGLYLALEPMEGNYLDQRGLPDGNVYNIEGTAGDKKRQGATHPTDASDWNTFRDGVNAAGQTETWYRQNIDLKALYSFYALNRLNGNVDIRPGDNLRFYHNPTNINGGTNGHWVVAPYDLDMMYVCGHHWSATIDDVVYPGVTDQFRVITRHANLAREYRNRARELLDLLASDASAQGGQVGQLIQEYAELVHPTGNTLTWATLDAALWNLHPRTAGDGSPASNIGYTNHKNNFFRTPYFDYRGVGAVPVTNWTRTLSDPDSDGYSDFNGLMTWFRNYATNTWPGGTWTRSNGNENGYGYKFLEWESLYGGLGSDPSSPDLSFPNTPTLTYAGPLNFPANALDFTSTAFSASANGGTSFAAMQWRIGEIYSPGIAGYVAGEPYKYEVEEVWTSPEITSFNAAIRVPVTATRPGHTYRARVRHKDANGGWSHWSAPVQFTVSVPDVTIFQQSLVISELCYQPAAATGAESTAGYTSEMFEWIELKNVDDQPLNLTGVRFTKGIDFDFPDGWTLPAGGTTLVVKNIDAFRFRYGTGLNAIIAGSYGTDSLRNEGEQLKLSYGAGTAIHDFVYGTATPWPQAAEKSLVLVAPQTLPNHALPENWRLGMTALGSPGTDDALHFTGTAEADTDQDGYPDLVEYALGSNPVITHATTPEGMTLTIPRIPNADDAVIDGQVATDLQDWVSADVISSSPTEVVYRVPAAMAVESRLFMRAKVRLR